MLVGRGLGSRVKYQTRRTVPRHDILCNLKYIWSLKPAYFSFIKIPLLALVKLPCLKVNETYVCAQVPPSASALLRPQ